MGPNSLVSDGQLHHHAIGLVVQRQHDVRAALPNADGDATLLGRPAREGRRESSSPLTTFTVHASSSNVIREI